MVAEQKGRRATLPDTEATSPDGTVFPLKIQKILAGAKKAFEKAGTIVGSTHAARQWLAYLAEQNRTTEDHAGGVWLSKKDDTQHFPTQKPRVLTTPSFR